MLSPVLQHHDMQLDPFGSAVICHPDSYKPMANWSCCPDCLASGLSRCSHCTFVMFKLKVSTAGLLYLYEMKWCMSQKLQSADPRRPAHLSGSYGVREQDLRGFVFQAGKFILMSHIFESACKDFSSWCFLY